MQAFPLGKIAVPTPGTAVQVIAAKTPCNRIRFEIPLANVAKAFVGIAGLVGSTLTNVIKQLQFSAAGEIADSWEIATENESNTIEASDYYVDAATGAEGVIVTYWVR